MELRREGYFIFIDEVENNEPTRNVAYINVHYIEECRNILGAFYDAYMNATVRDVRGGPWQVTRDSEGIVSIRKYASYSPTIAKFSEFDIVGIYKLIEVAELL